MRRKNRNGAEGKGRTVIAIYQNEIGGRARQAGKGQTVGRTLKQDHWSKYEGRGVLRRGARLKGKYVSPKWKFCQAGCQKRKKSPS